jgi:hypothetical protein
MEVNIQRDLREIWWEIMDRLLLAQDRDQCLALVYTAKNLGVPQMVGSFLTMCLTVSQERFCPTELVIELVV